MVISALNGAGVKSMQEKWEELFEEKEEEVVEEVMARSSGRTKKLPRKMTLAKKRRVIKKEMISHRLLKAYIRLFSFEY